MDTAHRMRFVCGQVFRYAIATGRAEHDPAADLRGALSPVKSRHLAAVTDPVKVGELLRAIEGYQGSFVTQCVLLLSSLSVLGNYVKQNGRKLTLTNIPGIEVLQVRPDFIEHQLAHAVRDPNGRVYNRTAHLVERRKMMQLWGDYLDGLKQGAKVLPMQRKDLTIFRDREGIRQARKQAATKMSWKNIMI